jgi:hypothetical protein
MFTAGQRRASQPGGYHRTEFSPGSGLSRFVIPLAEIRTVIITMVRRKCDEISASIRLSVVCGEE